MYVARVYVKNRRDETSQAAGASRRLSHAASLDRAAPVATLAERIDAVLFVDAT
jgi:hypothetical protein